MSAEYLEAPTAEAGGQFRLQAHGFLVRHRVEVLVEGGYEAHAVFPDDACGLDARLVIGEALLRTEPGHPDVVAGLAVAAGISQVDDVDGMMSGRQGPSSRHAWCFGRVANFP